jgi:peptide/nickel transport system substrate-binding protein
MVRTQGYENLVRWTPSWDGIMPNVAESFDVSADSREFTFHLRKGMKWSDGQPFTADDIMFWYEDVFSDPQLTPSKPAWLVTAGKPVVVEKIDDYTVKFKFSEPNGLFLPGLADVRGVRPTAHPKHYFAQFHPKYNKTNLDKLVHDAGVADWTALFQAKGGGSGDDIRWWNSQMPTLNGWMTTVGIGDTTSQMVAVRNPYYWKVDPQGHQLPYINRITYDFVNDPEALVVKAINGQIDMMDRNLASAANKPVLYDNQKQGGYHFFSTTSAAPNTAIISVNLNDTDPVKRGIFQNKDFRIGLSYAINRQQIIDLVYVGQGQPYQPAPLPGSPLYNEQLAKQYTAYDVDLANKSLDKAGYSKRDDKGFRLGPDGKRITVIVDVYTSYQPLVDAMQLVVADWQAVGIDALLRPADRSIVATRVGQGDYDIFANRPLDGGAGQTVIGSPYTYFPYSTLSDWALGWAAWYNKGTAGSSQVAPVEPPDPVKKQMALYDQIKVTGDPEKQQELMKQLLAISADQFFVLGLATEAPGYGVVANNMRNVPKELFNSYSWPSPAPSNTVQYFYDPPQK